jgi:hypothetical protein
MLAGDRQPELIADTRPITSQLPDTPSKYTLQTHAWVAKM